MKLKKMYPQHAFYWIALVEYLCYTLTNYASYMLCWKWLLSDCFSLSLFLAFFLLPSAHSHVAIYMFSIWLLTYKVGCCFLKSHSPIPCEIADFMIILILIWSEQWNPGQQYSIASLFLLLLSTHHRFLRNENYKTDTLNRIERQAKKIYRKLGSICFLVENSSKRCFFLIRNCKWIHRLKNRSKSSSLHLTSNAFFLHVIFFSFFFSCIFFSCFSRSFASWLFIESNEA